MIFRCCDCGSEYKIKPDYCDCGNDIFEEIEEQDIPSVIEPEQTFKPKIKHKKTFEEQYPEISSFMETLDPIAVIIFILCIILSICSFIFIKPKETVADEKTQVKEQIERKVEDINTFWNDTPPKKEPEVSQEKPTTEQNIIEKIINIAPKVQENDNKSNQKKPAQIQQTPSKTQIKSTQQQQTKKTTQTTTQTTAKPKQTVKKQQSQQQTQQPSQNKSQQPQKTVQQPVVPQNNQNIQQQTPSSGQIQQSKEPVVNKAQSEQELKTFKLGLQSAFASKIKGNLLQIYGDGSCVVDFKVNSSGKITDRSFSVQSTNNTLNDVVYNAVMSTPTYKAPPSSYSGQKLHLSVKISNGVVKISVY